MSQYITITYKLTKWVDENGNDIPWRNRVNFIGNRALAYGLKVVAYAESVTKPMDEFKQMQDRIDELEAFILQQSERIAAQSELLTKRACSENQLLTEDAIREAIAESEAEIHQHSKE